MKLDTNTNTHTDTHKHSDSIAKWEAKLFGSLVWLIQIQHWFKFYHPVGLFEIPIARLALGWLVEPASEDSSRQECDSNAIWSENQEEEEEQDEAK